MTKGDSLPGNKDFPAFALKTVNPFCDFHIRGKIEVVDPRLNALAFCGRLPGLSRDQEHTGDQLRDKQ